jgi:hypothetical protein
MKNAVLKALTKSQTDKIPELEKACANLQREKENVIVRYRKLAAKHKALVEKMEQEKMQLVEAQAKLAQLRDDLDLETCSYMKYHQNVCSRLCGLHEMLASSFDEIKAQCMPFPNKGVLAEMMIDCIGEETKAVPDTVWWLKNNSAILAIEGILNMLHGEGCQELSRPCDLAASRDVMVLENIQEDVRKLAGRNVRRWWKPHRLLRLYVGLRRPALKL